MPLKRLHKVKVDNPRTMLTLADIADAPVATLLAAYGLTLARVPDNAPIPGSYWGEPEAGIIGATVHARGDTPVHSLLHEAAHLIVLPPERRHAVHTDATDSVEEEDAVLVMQVLLGDALPTVGADRVLSDMDAWGYTFRLGSAAAYVRGDADAAWAWLQARGLVDAGRRLAIPEQLGNASCGSHAVSHESHAGAHKSIAAEAAPTVGAAATTGTS